MYIAKVNEIVFRIDSLKLLKRETTSLISRVQDRKFHLKFHIYATLGIYRSTETSSSDQLASSFLLNILGRSLGNTELTRSSA